MLGTGFAACTYYWRKEPQHLHVSTIQQFVGFIYGIGLVLSCQIQVDISLYIITVCNMCTYVVTNIHTYMTMHGCLHTCKHICIYTVYTYHSHNNFVSAEQKASRLSSCYCTDPSDRHATRNCLVSRFVLLLHTTFRIIFTFILKGISQEQ